MRSSPSLESETIGSGTRSVGVTSVAVSEAARGVAPLRSNREPGSASVAGERLVGAHADGPERAVRVRALRREESVIAAAFELHHQHIVLAGEPRQRAGMPARRAR